MQVIKGVVVTVTYQVWDAQGEVIQDAQEPMVYLHGGFGDVFVVIERALEGKSVNEEVWIQVEPEDAFGEYDPNLIRIEDRSLFPEQIEVGMQFEGIPEDPDEEAVSEEPPIWTITGVAEDKVVLDGNHPLAGVALRYYLKVCDIRSASEDELQRGSVAPEALSVTTQPLH